VPPLQPTPDNPQGFFLLRPLTDSAHSMVSGHESGRLVSSFVAGGAQALPQVFIHSWQLLCFFNQPPDRPGYYPDDYWPMITACAVSVAGSAALLGWICMMDLDRAQIRHDNPNGDRWAIEVVNTVGAWAYHTSQIVAKVAVLTLCAFSMPSYFPGVFLVMMLLRFIVWRKTHSSLSPTRLVQVHTRGRACARELRVGGWPLWTSCCARRACTACSYCHSVQLSTRRCLPTNWPLPKLRTSCTRAYVATSCSTVATPSVI
jgi:hypothetical protein